MPIFVPGMQADLISHRFEYVKQTPTKYPPDEILNFPAKYQYHGRWTDRSLVVALDFLEWYYGNLCMQHGGRNTLNHATWIKFYRGNNRAPGGLGALVFIIWLHEDKNDIVDGKFCDIQLYYHPSMRIKDNGEEEEESLEWADCEDEGEEEKGEEYDFDVDEIEEDESEEEEEVVVVKRYKEDHELVEVQVNGYYIRS